MDSGGNETPGWFKIVAGAWIGVVLIVAWRWFGTVRDRIPWFFTWVLELFPGPSQLLYLWWLSGIFLVALMLWVVLAVAWSWTRERD